MLIVDGSQEVTFLYKLTPGIAHRSYGYGAVRGFANDSLNVARLANLPNVVISVAGEKSRTMEDETKQREVQRWSHYTLTVTERRNEKALEVVKAENVDVEALKELAKRLD